MSQTRPISTTQPDGPADAVEQLVVGLGERCEEPAEPGGDEHLAEPLVGPESAMHTGRPRLGRRPSGPRAIAGRLGFFGQVGRDRDRGRDTGEHQTCAADRGQAEVEPNPSKTGQCWPGRARWRPPRWTRGLRIHRCRVRRCARLIDITVPKVAYSTGVPTPPVSASGRERAGYRRSAPRKRHSRSRAAWPSRRGRRARGPRPLSRGSAPSRPRP